MRTPCNRFPSLRDAIDVGAAAAAVPRSTIAQLAILLEQPMLMQHQSRTELVGIQPHGFKPPLYFFSTFCAETSYAHASPDI